MSANPFADTPLASLAERNPAVCCQLAEALDVLLKVARIEQPFGVCLDTVKVDMRLDTGKVEERPLREALAAVIVQVGLALKAATLVLDAKPLDAPERWRHHLGNHSSHGSQLLAYADGAEDEHAQAVKWREANVFDVIRLYPSEWQRTAEYLAGFAEAMLAVIRPEEEGSSVIRDRLFAMLQKTGVVLVATVIKEFWPKAKEPTAKGWLKSQCARLRKWLELDPRYHHLTVKRPPRTGRIELIDTRTGAVVRVSP